MRTGQIPRAAEGASVPFLLRDAHEGADAACGFSARYLSLSSSGVPTSPGVIDAPLRERAFARARALHTMRFERARQIERGGQMRALHVAGRQRWRAETHCLFLRGNGAEPRRDRKGEINKKSALPRSFWYINTLLCANHSLHFICARASSRVISPALQLIIVFTSESFSL